MKATVQHIFLLLVTALFTVNANAHPGHDHSALSSPAVHAVFYFAIAAIVLLAGYVTVKIINKETDSDK